MMVKKIQKHAPQFRDRLHIIPKYNCLVKFTKMSFRLQSEVIIINLWNKTTSDMLRLISSLSQIFSTSSLVLFIWFVLTSFQSELVHV